MVSTILTIIQLVVAGLLVVAILLQQKNAGLGSAFGGGASGAYTSRRGIDRVLFNITIALSIVFFALALVNLIV